MLLGKSQSSYCPLLSFGLRATCYWASPNQVTALCFLFVWRQHLPNKSQSSYCPLLSFGLKVKCYWASQSQSSYCPLLSFGLKATCYRASPNQVTALCFFSVWGQHGTEQVPIKLPPFTFFWFEGNMLPSKSQSSYCPLLSLTWACFFLPSFCLHPLDLTSFIFFFKWIKSTNL